jgi:hypothetical protein
MLSKAKRWFVNISINPMIYIIISWLSFIALYAGQPHQHFTEQTGEPLLKLLEIVGMEPLNPSEEALPQINQWAQKNLLRQGERWDKQTDKFEDLTFQLKPLLTELGFVEGTPPHLTEYRGAIIHGSLYPTVSRRLHYLIEQWNRGIRFSQLYFLSSDLPLDSGQTECEMVRNLWNQSQIPESMQEVQVFFINAPMKNDTKGNKTIRPTTEDTIIYWLQANPPPGCYLAISNAPYINRQDLVIKTIAGKDYTFDTAGYGAKEEEKMAIFLDELARFIFTTAK